MKRLLFVPLGLLLFASCKEKGPDIDFGAKASDTAFTAAVETQADRMVVIEEFTGVTCPNCPAGHVVLKTMDDANPGRLAIVGIQLFNNTQANPVNQPTAKTINDNRTQAGTSLCSGIFGTNNSLPSAGIDRSPVGSVLLLGRNDWPAAVNARLAMPAKANCKITSTYDAASRIATVKVHVAYTSPVSVNQLLTVALIENNVVDAQEFTSFDPVQYEQNYVHEHVLRDILTAPAGSAILSGFPTKAAGQVYERTFVYTLPGNVLNPDNCQFVAYVSDNSGTDKEVVQGAEVNLK